MDNKDTNIPTALALSRMNILPISKCFSFETITKDQYQSQKITN